MRALVCLVLVLAGCAGPDADPEDVAARFHATRAAGDDRSMHALFTRADRDAVPLSAFPSALPRGLTETLLGWSGVPADSVALLSESADTARVAVFTAGATDTVVLAATRTPRPIPVLALERVVWRVSLRLPERVRLDSLADALAEDGLSQEEEATRARAVLASAEAYPELAHPEDVQAARAVLRHQTVAKALGIELRVAESFMGTRFIQGRVTNPTDSRVAILRLRVRDARGEEQWLDVWDVAAGPTEVRQLTQLRPGPVTYALERVQLY